MKEILKNKEAWNLLSADHYQAFKKALKEVDNTINANIIKELGDIRGKSLIHLQCNIGFDTISLARMGLKKVTGIDLSDQNIRFANKLKHDFGMDHIEYIESNVLTLDQTHHDKYDIVFTSEGVLGWLPDLTQWAKVIRHVLKDDGYFYIYDSHPFFHVFDPEALSRGELHLKYDYLNAKADQDFIIGGYASEAKRAENYWWNHSLSDIINALIGAGLKIEYLHEYDTLFWNNGNMKKVSYSLYEYPQWRSKLPLSYSIKATLNK
mgnify:FL=1